LTRTRPPPPLWLMGMGFIPLGASGSVVLFITPQLLAAAHVPEPSIAWVTSIALAPVFLGFLAAPLLDWRFSRRDYAIGLSAVSAVCAFAGLMNIGDLPLLSALLFACNLAANLAVWAVGGWFGEIIGDAQKAALGAWFTVANIAGFGLIATIALSLLRAAPYALGAGLISLSVVAAVPLYLSIPCPPADGRLAKESLRDFSHDVLDLLKRRTVLWTLPMFLAPTAAYALSNTLSGLGGDFHTSEGMVSLIGGLGSTIAGVIGSLLVPRLDLRIRPRPLYLLIGAVGAGLNLALAGAPHNPFTFGLAFLAENALQAAAFSVANLIILRTIGHDNPLAATQFGLLTAAYGLPLIYMQFIDGQAYGLGGAAGAFLADAALSAGACAILAALLWWRRRDTPAI